MLTWPAAGEIPDRPLHIGDVADLTGLSLRSIRHYEDLGLVTPQGRTSGGFRVYGAEAVRRLRLVMELKMVGLSLEQIGPVVDSLARLESGAGDEQDAAVVRQGEDLVSAALPDLERRVHTARTLQERLGAARGDG